jgi:hypothetical protein
MRGSVSVVSIARCDYCSFDFDVVYVGWRNEAWRCGDRIEGITDVGVYVAFFSFFVEVG